MTPPMPARYRLVVRDDAGRPPTIRVLDRRSGQVMLNWCGPVARHLLDTRSLPREVAATGLYHCDKHLVWHLILAGTAAQRVVDQCARLRSELGETVKDLFDARPRHRPRVPAQSAGPVPSAIRPIQ